ncbi:MAG: hypothetical protein R3F30_02065 [Planctomycetota bacterium]
MSDALLRPYVLRPLPAQPWIPRALADLLARMAGGDAGLSRTLANDRIALHFEADPEVGVRLVAITQINGDERFDWDTDPPPESGHDGRLFEVRGTLEKSGEELRVGPTADGFFARTGRPTAGEQSLLFGWTHVEVTGTTDRQVLWVLVRVRLRDGDPRSRWDLWVGRREDRGFSIDEVQLPVLWVKGPVAQRPFEPHYLAQVRARLLIPTGLTGIQPFNSANSPLLFWLTYQEKADRRFEHPSAGQILQFSCLYAADSGDLQSHRRMLYVGSEDAVGEHKAFEHRTKVVSTEAGDEGWYRWRHCYRTPYEDALAPDGPDGRRPFDEFGNSFASPYPAVVGVLKAETDAFWYDACALYRDWAQASGAAGPRISENPALTSRLSGPSLFSTTFFDRNVTPPDPGVYHAMLRHLLAWQRSLSNPWVDLSRAYLHAQIYRYGGQGVDSDPPNPQPPIADDLDTGWAQVMQWARRLDVRCSAYTIPMVISPSSLRYDGFPSDAFVYRRDHVASGNQFTGQDTRGNLVDYRNPRGQRFYVDRLCPEMSQTGFGGMYLDLISGIPSWLLYTPPPGLEATHPGNLGDIPGRAAALPAIRNSSREASTFISGAEPDGDLFLISEAVMEGLVGLLDLNQDGYLWAPGHLQLAEEVLTSPGAPEIPVQARDLSPPLWSAVYHEHQPTFRLEPPMNLVALGSNPRYYPNPGGFTGLTPDEFLDFTVLFPFLSFVAGYKPVFEDQMDFGPPTVDLDDDEVATDPEADPTGVGLRVMAALRNLWTGYADTMAGTFVVDGRMERPLVLDFDGGEIDTAPNPTAAWKRVDPAHSLGFMPPSYIGATYPLAEFPVPRVLHSMWRDRDGRLGLVLANWTRAEARWAGSFDPRLYGFGAGAQVEVRERLCGNPSRLVGRPAGVTMIRADEALVRLGGDLWIGRLAPHEVRVLEFLPG